MLFIWTIWTIWTKRNITAQVDDSGHRIRKDPAGNAAFSGTFLQVPAYFPPDPAGKAPEDGSSIPAGTSSYAETGKSGKFPLPDSIRKQKDPSGKPAGNQRFPSEPGRKSSYRSRMSVKKYRFPRDADKIIQYFLGHRKTNKKSFLKISVRLFLF